MGITQNNVAVGTAAVPLNAPQVNPGMLHITNLDNTSTVYVGGSVVTTSTGHGIEKSAHIDMAVYPLQVLYAVSSQSNHSVSWVHITP